MLLFKEVCPTEMRVYSLKTQGRRRNGGSTNQASYSYLVIGPNLAYGVFSSFLFLYFSKTFFTEIYFQFHNLQFYTPTARQGGGRDLYVNKNNFYLRGGSWREPAAPPLGGREGRQGPAARQGWQASPPCKIATVGH